MQDFYQQQWDDLCRRMQQSAQHFAENDQTSAANMIDAAQQFTTRSCPRSYQELLDRYREAAELAIPWQNGAKTSSQP